jgi:hypothetical protein
MTSNLDSSVSIINWINYLWGIIWNQNLFLYRTPEVRVLLLSQHRPVIKIIDHRYDSDLRLRLPLLCLIGQVLL